MLARGYRLGFATVPPCFNVVITSRAQGESGELSVINLDHSSPVVHALAGESEASPLWWPVAPPTEQRRDLSGTRANISPPPGQAHTIGLAPEWFNLRHNVLSQRVINTIQSAKA